VVRTNFFGWGVPHRPSFSDWIVSALRRGETLRMFSDVYFTPMLVNDLSAVLLECIDRRLSGLWNIAGADRLSKYDFARHLALEFGLPSSRIEEISVRDLRLAARRPNDMSLSCARIEAVLGRSMPRSSEGLARLRRLEQDGWPATLHAAAVTVPQD
jgi:dTDP-4-dehydrorhamnose reductase